MKNSLSWNGKHQLFSSVLSEDLQSGSKILELGHSHHTRSTCFSMHHFLCLHIFLLYSFQYLYGLPQMFQASIPSSLLYKQTSTQPHLTYLLALSFVLIWLLVHAVTLKELKKKKKRYFVSIIGITKHLCLSKERVNSLFILRIVRSLHHLQVWK